MRLADKTAIVTGAGSGFGKGIAERFAAEGARIVVADLNADAASSVASQIGGLAITVDVARGDSVRTMVETVMAAYGGIDIIVNNAGTTHPRGDMLTVDEATFDRVLAVNVKSIYLTAVHAVPHMVAGGSILNMASTAGVRPRPGLTWYNGTKGAVITLTKSMAVELAPKGIRVNALNPVVGDTGLTALFLGENTPEMRETFRQTIPLGRFSTPEDIANAALYLSSDEASFHTGVCLEVDGGRCI